MGYVYMHNVNGKTPILLIDKYIGKDASGKVGIDGAVVAREVLALKESGKTELEVWINSKGGNVSEGYSIYSALKRSGLKITTVNQGLVDSTAGWIYQAGDKRIWMKHGIGLIHEATNAAGESIEAVNESVAEMLVQRSNRSKEQIRELMSRSTIMNHELAEEYGFCDDVVNSSVDILSVTNTSDLSAVKDQGDEVIKKALLKTKRMLNINELLGLNNEASEASTYKAIQELITAKNEADNLVKTLTEAKNAAETKVNSLTEALTTTTNSLTTTEAKLLEMENASKVTKAEALIAEHKGNRLPDDAAALEHWKKQAIADYDGTKAIIETLNVNKKAPNHDGDDAKPKGGSSFLEGTAPVLDAAAYRHAPVYRKGQVVKN